MQRRSRHLCNLRKMPNLQSLDSANYFSARTINLFFIRTHFPIGLLVLFLFVNSSRARRFPTQRFIGCLPKKKVYVKCVLFPVTVAALLHIFGFDTPKSVSTERLSSYFYRPGLLSRSIRFSLEISSVFIELDEVTGYVFSVAVAI